MSERRAIPRVSLAVPATIYDGRAEIHCKTRDVSPLGVGVTGVPEDLPAQAMRLRLSATERTPSVLFDCYPVAQHSDIGGTWGFRFLNDIGDLPAGFEQLLGNAMKEPPDNAHSPPAPRISPNFFKASSEPGESDRAGFEKQLQDLFGEALDSLD